MKRVVTATEARIRFGALISRVAETREAVIVERGVKPQAVVLSLPEYERLLERQHEEQNEWNPKPCKPARSKFPENNY